MNAVAVRGSRRQALPPQSATALTAGPRSPLYAGGAGGTRTPDFRLAKAALSQLSYGPTPAVASAVVASGRGCWWAILDSNQGPQSYQDCALTS